MLQLVRLADQPQSPIFLNGTIIVEVVAFLVMLLFLGRVVYPVINRQLERRQALIAEQIGAAENSRREAEERLKQAMGELDQARRQAQEVLNSASQAGEQMRQELSRKAQEDADRMLERARGEIELARRQAVEGLRSDVAGLVLQTASRLVQAELDVERHRSLIESAVRDVESLASKN
jgi:F-type H+-transporting ATPase subunit b